MLFGMIMIVSIYLYEWGRCLLGYKDSVSILIYITIFENNEHADAIMIRENHEWIVSNFVSYSLILDAVRKKPHSREATDKDIEHYIARWLQLAPDRDGGRK